VSSGRIRRARRWFSSGRSEPGVVAAGVGAGILFAMGAALIGWSSRLEVVLTVGVAAALAVFAVHALRGAVDPLGWSLPTSHNDHVYKPEDRVEFLQRRLEIATTDPRIFETRIQPVLVSLTTNVLRRKHGLDIDRDRSRAREVAGPLLWDMVTLDTATIARSPTSAQLSAAIDQLERLSAP